MSAIALVSGVLLFDQSVSAIANSNQKGTHCCSSVSFMFGNSRMDGKNSVIVLKYT